MKILIVAAALAASVATPASAAQWWTVKKATPTMPHYCMADPLSPASASRLWDGEIEKYDDNTVLVNFSRHGNKVQIPFFRSQTACETYLTASDKADADYN